MICNIYHVLWFFKNNNNTTVPTRGKLFVPFGTSKCGSIPHNDGSRYVVLFLDRVIYWRNPCQETLYRIASRYGRHYHLIDWVQVRYCVVNHLKSCPQSIPIHHLLLHWWVMTYPYSESKRVLLEEVDLAQSWGWLVVALVVENRDYRCYHCCRHWQRPLVASTSPRNMPWSDYPWNPCQNTRHTPTMASFVVVDRVGIVLDLPRRYPCSISCSCCFGIETSWLD